MVNRCLEFHTHTRMHAHTHTHTHTSARVHAHTHTHTHTHTQRQRINTQFARIQKLAVMQTVKSQALSSRQDEYCLQNLGITCIAYSFSPPHEMPKIFRHFMKCLTSRIACNISISIYLYIYILLKLHCAVSNCQQP